MFSPSVVVRAAGSFRIRRHPLALSTSNRARETYHASKSPSVESFPKNNRFRMPEDDHYKLSPEVKDALYTNKPVVALETTIYTHGFPYPDNVALALDLESIVRRNGGVPATIGIIDGVARIGMDTEQLRLITASAGKSETMKISRRDLPYILGLVS
jgi:pseudouridine-5'-phosphate glycosidase/pseudouridine kinase